MIHIDIAMEQEGMCSINAYKQFLSNFKTSFIFSSSHYLVNQENLKNDIDALLPLLFKDIKSLSVN